MAQELRIPVWALLAVVAVAAAAAALLLRSQGESVLLPDFAKKNPRTEAAYTFAARNPAALEGLPCACGCMHHPHYGRLHRGLNDCFLRDGGYEVHGSECDVCVLSALDVQAMTLQGVPREEVVRQVQAKYFR